VLSQHPTKPTHTTLHRLDGTTICTIENRRLDKLHDIYNHSLSNPPFEEALAKLILKQDKQHHPKKILRELQLSKAKSVTDTQPLLCGGWLIPDRLYDTLHDCFQIDRVLHCGPYNLPIRANIYYSEDPYHQIFSAKPLTNTAWTGMTLSLPEFQPDKLTKALEQAIYSAHTHKDSSPSATILILPDWKHTPYLSRNLHTNYVQKIATVPHTPTSHGTSKTKYNLNIYLVANSKALSTLDPHTIYDKLRSTLTLEQSKSIIHKFHTYSEDAIHIDSRTIYSTTPTPTRQHHTTIIPHTTPHVRKWDPKSFVYTDGSHVKGNPVLGAGVVNPITNTNTHIQIKSQPERHTINKAELAAITVALRQENTNTHLQILTDSSFCINTIRNYATDPSSYNNHLHKDLLQLTDQLLRTRETNN
jgi:hypothetical protein